MPVVLCPTLGFVLKLAKGHVKMTELFQIGRELRIYVCLGFSDLKNVNNHGMHHDSVYPLRCSIHFSMHLAAHPDDTESLRVHYHCQSGLQVVSAEHLSACFQATAAWFQPGTSALTNQTGASLDRENLSVVGLLQVEISALQKNQNYQKSFP